MKKKMPPQFGHGVSLWGIFLGNDGCGMAQPTVGCGHPRAHGPGWYKKADRVARIQDLVAGTRNHRGNYWEMIGFQTEAWCMQG